MEPLAHPRPSPAPALPNLAEPPDGLRREAFHAMGTTISVFLLDEQAQVGEQTVRDVFAEWEARLSRFLPESELSFLNAHTGMAVQVSPLLFKVLDRALAAARSTGGIYDPTLLNQMLDMGYDRTFEQVPTMQAARGRVPMPGGAWRLVHVDRARREVMLPPGIGLDFGGIAKGMAVDAAIERLRSLRITTALLNAGGDLVAMGTPPTLDHWPVSIEGKDTSWNIPLRFGALATSGVSRRRWQQGMQQRHHLIDPRTGESARIELWTVTAAAGTCEQGEVAAKVAFLLGEVRGREFLEQQGLAGLLTREDGRWTAAGPWPVEAMKTL